MGHGQPTPAGRTVDARAADHSQHATGRTQTSSGRAAGAAHPEAAHAAAAGDPHAGHAPAAAAPPAATAPGMDKLMTLVAELVRDSVVQRRIAQDPVLREQWENPAVRRVLLRRQ